MYEAREVTRFLDLGMSVLGLGNAENPSLGPRFLALHALFLRSASCVDGFALAIADRGNRLDGFRTMHRILASEFRQVSLPSKGPLSIRVPQMTTAAQCFICHANMKRITRPAWHDSFMDDCTAVALAGSEVRKGEKRSHSFSCI